MLGFKSRSITLTLVNIGLPKKDENGMSRKWKFRILCPLPLVLCILFIAAGAEANVIVNSISVPSSVGRGLDANVDIVWTRINTAAATITTPIPTQLTVNPPHRLSVAQ
jgi:hypothetical protein